MYCRNFPPAIEALAAVWSTSAVSTDTWTPTGRTWGTNSQPIEVANQNNVRAVAKPGNPVTDGVLRAAHEKIVSDLAYAVGAPVPPVILWDRGAGHPAGRYSALSAWAFSVAIEWHHAVSRLSAAQQNMAISAASAMVAVELWVGGGQDRKADHILVDDDGDASKLGLAYIDYAFACSYEWKAVGAPMGTRPPSLPVAADPATVREVIAKIQAIDERWIEEVVNRLPAECLPDVQRAIILPNLLSRRGTLGAWLGV